MLSEQSIHVEYGGISLRSHQLCVWRVRAWDQAGRASECSPPARWSMGVLRPEEWRAEWVGYTRPDGRDQDTSVTLRDARWIWHPEPGELDEIPEGVRYLRRAFTLDRRQPVASAMCRLTADDRFALWPGSHSSTST